MSIRTTETTVTFRHPFALAALDGRQPAGTYRLVTEEEQIPGLSFVAFRRLATMLHLPADPAPGDTSQVVSVDPAELAALLAADATGSCAPTG
jgi:hypothetical protein